MDEFGWSPDEAPVENAPAGISAALSSSVTAQGANKDVREATSGLPKVTFELAVAGEAFQITTDYLPLFQTAFSHPAEMDKHVLKLKHLRTVVYEAYLQAKDEQRKAAAAEVAQRAMLRADVVAKAKSAGEKMTVADIDAALVVNYGAALDEAADRTARAEAKTARLNELYFSIIGRGKELLEIASRFAQSIPEYDAILGE